MKTLTYLYFIRRSLFIPLVAFASAASGNAALLSPVAVTSDMGSLSIENIPIVDTYIEEILSKAAPKYGTPIVASLINTINGSGLSPFNLDGVHAPTDLENSWASELGTTEGNIIFDLGGLQLIDGFSFWNLNAGGPEEEGINGINKVTIWWSTDDKVYSKIDDVPGSFDRQTGETSSPQQISFAPVNAAFVKFTVESNFGSVNYTGFAETQFRTASVPDAGSTLALLGITLLGLGALKSKSSR